MQTIQRVGIVLGVLSLAVAISSVYGADLEVIEPRRSQMLPQASRYFTDLFVRHDTQTYYDDQGYLIKQVPHILTKGRFGARFYGNRFEIFAEAGVLKTADTQQVIQARPLIGAFYYPWLTAYHELLIYLMNQLPFSEPGADDTSVKVEQQGSIVTIGVSPQLAHEGRWGGMILGINGGVDLFTRLYSRSQSVEGQSSGEKPEMIALNERLKNESIEDTRSRLWHSINAGFFFSPVTSRSLMFELQSVLQAFHFPKYFIESDEIKYSYKARKTSHLRFRATYKINSQLVLRNDLYKYYSGFYGAPLAVPDSTLRNVLHLGFQF